MIDQAFGRGFSFIVGSVYLCFILSLAPLSGWFSYIRPDMILLVILFWSQVMPSGFGLKAAFLVGLLFDVLLGEVLGTYALCLVLLTYLQLLLNRRFRVLSGFQQTIRVVLFSVIYLVVLRLLQKFLGNPVPMVLGHWLPVVSNALIWPWFYLLMVRLKSVFGLYEYNN